MSLATERRGSGEPLVLLHALGLNRRMWAPVLDLVAAEREAIALDLPGFGGSPALANGAPATPAALAAVVAAELRALNVERPHVAGNSLGGWIALELALAGKARTVTALAPAGLWPQPLLPKRSPTRALARVLLPAMPALLLSERGRRAVLAASAAHPERIPPRFALALVRSYATSPGFDAANAAMRAAHFTDLARISVPVTLAWAEHDRLIARPKRLPRNVRSVVLRGCGHLPTWDDPGQVAAVILAGSSP